MSEKATPNTEPTTTSVQGQEPPQAAASDKSLAGEPMEMDTTAHFMSPRQEGAAPPAYGASRSSNKPGSSSSSETKELETIDEDDFSRQIELLGHISQDPSIWSAEVLQAIALHHIGTVKEMSQDKDQDWKLVRNDYLHQAPLNQESCIRQRIILYTRLDRDVRISSFIHLYDPADKSLYFYIANEAGHEQTVNLEFKHKVWEKRLESQRTHLVRTEREVSVILTELSLSKVLRSKGEKQKEQRNKMLNLLCTLSVVAFKELGYAGLVVLTSKDSFKEFNRLKRERDEFFLKDQSQVIKTIYEGLNHLNRNGFYIPQLRKDYFVRDSERRESEDRLMLQESKTLVKRLQKAHRERSGILTIENPHEVTAELAKSLGQAKELKKNTPLTIKDLEAKNLEAFSNRVAQVIGETLGITAHTTASSASTMSTMLPERLFHTPDQTLATQTSNAQSMTSSRTRSTPEESQQLVDEMMSIKRMLRELQGLPNPPETNKPKRNGPSLSQRPWSAATPQIPPRTHPGNQGAQGAVPRPAVRFESGSQVKPSALKKLVLETVTEQPTLTQQDIHLEPYFDAPSNGKRTAPPQVRELQEQLQQLRLGPTVASTPLRTNREPQGNIEPPTPIIRPTGTIPKPNVNRTELDDKYQPTVTQPGMSGGITTSAISTAMSQLNPPILGLTTQPAQETGTGSETSDDDGQVETQYQTAMDTVVTNPAQFATVAQELEGTVNLLDFDRNQETGVGRPHSVIRELFGRDTIRATLMERALLDWIRMEARIQSQQQIAWY